MEGKGHTTVPGGSEKAASPNGWDAFVSHSSADDELASRLEQNLQEMGLTMWVDHSDLRRRGLLLSALQEALLRCAYLVLLWSQAAEQSRYVTAEWNFAWNREILILPCRLDQSLLPLGLAGYLYCDFRTDFDIGFSQLKEALQGVTSVEITPDDDPLRSLFSKLKLKPGSRIDGVFCKTVSPDKVETFNELKTLSISLLTALEQGRLDAAAHLQARLDPLVEAAMQAYPDDAYLLSMAGYQKKNAYQ